MAVQDPQDSTVTYVNFGTRKKVTAPDEVLTVDRRSQATASGRSDSRADGAGVISAAQRLSSLISEQVDPTRFQRGQEYARQGHVVGLDVRNGAIHGRVAGSQNEPFAVLIQLPYRTKEQLNEVAELMARTPGALREAREGRLPARVVEILLGTEAGDIRHSCTCPDPAYVCKHVAAVAIKLAARMDADPELVFSMRGMNLSALEQLMMVKAHEVSRDSAATNQALGVQERNELFWQGRELPAVPTPKVAPALQDSDVELLRRALRAVTHTNLELLRAVSDIEDLYDFLTR